MSTAVIEKLSVGEAVRDASARLKVAGIDEAVLEARLLTGFAISGNGDGGSERVLAERDRTMTPQETDLLQNALNRREAHEPMAHIVGRREFWSLMFTVTPETLIPRPDSETLVEAALETAWDRDAPLKLLDLGTGSGCLLLALLSELPNATGLGIDASGDALSVATLNAESLGLGERATFLHADWTHANWKAGLDAPYDLVISNPPYISEPDFQNLDVEVREFEPRRALHGGVDGLDAYRRLVPEMFLLLRSGGTGIFEVGQGQAEHVAKLFTDGGFCEPENRADLGGIKRTVLALKPA